MKIGKLVSTNKKGQLVIPQEYRQMFGITQDKTLNIVPKQTGLFIQPIKEVTPDVPSEDLYDKLLEKTAGAWGKDSFPETSKKRRTIELEASKRRKEAW